MRKGYYGKEPFDAKLALLRFFRNFHWIVIAVLAGTFLFGGGYYVKNVLLQKEKQFCAVSVYKVEYADPQWAQNGTYLNYMTWDTWVNTEEVKEFVRKYLGTDVDEAGISVSAAVDSDHRMPSTKVFSASSVESLLYAQALEKALANDFPKANPVDIAGIRVVDPAVKAEEVYPDVRPVRAVILSAILSFFFATVIFFLKEWGEDSIWIPAQMYRRYGLKILDTIQKQGFEADLSWYFGGKERIAVCPVDEETDVERICGFLRDTAEKNGKENPREWIAFPAILADRSVCGKLKENDGLILLVRAGHHAGKPLEYVLQILDQHECTVTCAMLIDADEKLIRNYYRFR